MMAQDFGDDGELYRHELPRVVRCILEYPDEEDPRAILRLQVYHDISGILTQIEREKAAELALQRTDETGQESIAHGALRTRHISVKHGKAAAGSVADAEVDAVSQHSKAEEWKGAVVRDGEGKAALRRILNLGHKKNTTVPLNRPTIEEVKSWFR